MSLVFKNPTVDERVRTARKSYARTPTILDLPRLTEVQLSSFEWFKTTGLSELLAEISPIVSFNKNLELHFGDFHFGESKYPVDECRERDITYSAPLWVTVKLVNKDTGEISEQEVFMGDFPLMTDSATFIINGSERVVVSQLIRSPGVYFSVEEDRGTGRELANAKMIPGRGAWLEFETSKRDIVSVKVDRKRKLPVTILLRAIGFGTDNEIRELFMDVDNDFDHPFIESTLERDSTSNPTDNSEKGVEEALLEFYKKLRPGDPPTLDNARNFMQNLFFAPRRYDLGRVGRYKLNRRLGLDASLETRVLTNEDIVAIIRRIIDINNGQASADDIDHLGNRRIKTVGELIQSQIRIGLLRMERVVRERMSIRDPEQVTPLSLINIRPVVAATREFFGGSQLSQFMDQTNPLSELTHKRRLSALGPGGLRRERAGFDVRDVHFSHYGRICPIETPEGPNIGLIGTMATYGRVNDFGFVETPYRNIIKSLPPDSPELLGHELRAHITDPESGDVLIERGTRIDVETRDLIAEIAESSKDTDSPLTEVPLKPFASRDVIFLTADEDEGATIAQASAKLNAVGEFVDSRPSARQADSFLFAQPMQLRYMDVSPKQIVGVSAALIPFLEHDDANRALMGSNMQRQAVPLIKPDAPAVGTGMDHQSAVDSGQVVLAQSEGEVVSVTGAEVVIQEEDGTRRVYPMRKYQRSNQSTCIDQYPIVYKGDQVVKGTILANSSSTRHGELALGQNVIVAYMCWEGGNFEDAILISQRLVQDDKFTSIHIEKYEVDARETKLGPEEITRDIPNVGEDALKDLDEEGIIRVGAEVKPGDILVGKITPKGETELTPEEKLLRAIFGEKAREVKDSSLRLPHGQRGKIVNVKVFDREDHREMAAGVEKIVRVSLAQRRRLTEGDKMAGRHGNKGVISKVVPVEDMPFLEDGTPVDIILNPLGVPGRMNIGQILEAHLGWASTRLGFLAETPVFDGAKEYEIEAELSRAWLIDRAWTDIGRRAWAQLKADGIDTAGLLSTSDDGLMLNAADANSMESLGLIDDYDARLYYLIGWLEPLGYSPEKIFEDESYARHACLREWLRERGYQPEQAIPDEYGTKSTSSEANVLSNEIALREWIVYYNEVCGLDMGLGIESEIRSEEEWSVLNLSPSQPDSESIDAEDTEAQVREMVQALSLDELNDLTKRAAHRHSLPLPITGKQTVYNGHTGEPYDLPVTIGVVQMLKLHHLVEDKVHARSTGPYSLVTQQPLGGKAQFGGQRFGEMEVWALEAYGASHILQEMLTVKSDDVSGRVKTYESIVKGEDIQSPGVPESFRVLVKELQSLGLAVEVINEKDEVIQFGKEDSEERLPKLGFSLNIPGPMSRVKE